MGLLLPQLAECPNFQLLMPLLDEPPSEELQEKPEVEEQFVLLYTLIRNNPLASSSSTLGR